MENLKIGDKVIDIKENDMLVKIAICFDMETILNSFGASFGMAGITYHPYDN